MGLGTCWIIVNDVDENIKKSILNYDKGEVNLLLAIGYPVDETVREHKFDDRKGQESLGLLDKLGKKASHERTLSKEDLMRYFLMQDLHHQHSMPNHEI